MVFLLFVLVASALGIAVVLLRNRRPTSMEASISDFERSLRALAPEDEPPPPVRPDRNSRSADRGADDPA